MKKSYLELGSCAAVVILTCAFLGIVVMRLPSPVQRGPDSATLLMTAAEWQVNTPDFTTATVESIRHPDAAGEAVDTRRWTIARPGDDLVVRQDVSRERNENDAHIAFAEDDPSAAMRKHFGEVQKIRSGAAKYADEAIGYCVPRPTGCFIVDYWLRYKWYLVEFSLAPSVRAAGGGTLERESAF